MSRQRKEKNALIRAFLVAHYPKCFLPPKTPKKPLKIGIFDDLRKFHPEIDWYDLRCALTDYTCGPSYRALLIEGRARFDLSGNVCGHVTANHSAHAREKMETLSEKTRALWSDILSLQQAAE